jgi:hypothetical protein
MYGTMDYEDMREVTLAQGRRVVRRKKFYSPGRR